MSEFPTTNLDQQEFWNDIKGKLWVDLQPEIDAMLGPFGEKAMEALNPQPGEKILEIGCGTGTMTLALADRVKTSGEIRAADISRPMLQMAISRAKAVSAQSTAFVEADAQVHAFPKGTFDAVFSRFGVMFFEDPIAAFRNFHSAVRSGGRLAYVCWADRKDNPWIRIPTGASKAFLEIPPPPEDDAPGQFAMEREARVREILGEAGWTSIELERFDIDHSLGENVIDAADFISQMGPMSEPFALADNETKKQCLEVIQKALKPYEGPTGVRMRFGTWIVRALRS